MASAKPSSVAPLMAIVTVRLCGATAQVELSLLQIPANDKPKKNKEVTQIKPQKFRAPPYDQASLQYLARWGGSHSHEQKKLKNNRKT